MKNIRIAINALSGRVGGGVTGFRFLLPALGRLGCDDEFHVIISPRQTVIREAVPPGFKVHFVSFDATNLVKRVLFEQVVLPVLLLRWKIDVLYSVGNTTSLLAPCKVVLLMENSNPYSRLDLPWSWKERIHLRTLRLLGALSAWRADRIRFVSEDSRNLLCNQLGISREKTSVIYHGYSPVTPNGSMKPVDGSTLPGRFILTVSTLAPHKNLERLMAAFNLLVERSGYPGELLIIGSGWFHGYAKRLRHLQSTLAHGARIHFLGEKSAEELASYYRAADAFVWVSLEETFGLPVVEAMGYGAPVVTGQCPVDGPAYFNPSEEICGDAAAYCNPLDVQSIAGAMQSVLSDPARRELLRRGGSRRADDFNWAAVAGQLHQCFHRAVHEQLRLY